MNNFKAVNGDDNNCKNRSWFLLNLFKNNSLYFIFTILFLGISICFYNQFKWNLQYQSFDKWFVANFNIYAVSFINCVMIITILFFTFSKKTFFTLIIAYFFILAFSIMTSTFLLSFLVILSNIFHINLFLFSPVKFQIDIFLSILSYFNNVCLLMYYILGFILIFIPDKFFGRGCGKCEFTSKSFILLSIIISVMIVVFNNHLRIIATDILIFAFVGTLISRYNKSKGYILLLSYVVLNLLTPLIISYVFDIPDLLVLQDNLIFQCINFYFLFF